MLSSLLKEIVGQKKEMIEKLASIEKRSVSNFIRHLVYQYLDNFIKKV